MAARVNTKTSDAKAAEDRRHLPTVTCAGQAIAPSANTIPTRQGWRLGEDAFAKLLSVLESPGRGAIAGPFSGRTSSAAATLHMMKNF